MAHDSTRRTATIHVRASVLEARWQKLCALYLPRAPKDSMWRYAKGHRRRQPSSGWKLHISATILSASTVLNKIAPFLTGRGVPFKAPRSLMEVGKLNSGLDYNYSQIGKIITVYPRSDAEAVFLAQRLHKLTRRMSAPSVPFDLRFSDTSNVYYRFGAFQHLELTRSGQQVPAVNAPDGNLIPDIREQPKPDWASDPFVVRRPRSRPVRQKAASSIRVVKALVQRGKGGVYVAIDFSSGSPRPCLLKEGRKNGELTWDGRDGAWRIRNEEQVLTRLSKRGVPVPQVQSSFEKGGNRYLVMQYLDGETLHDTLLRRHRRLAVSRVLDYAIQLAKFISQMHGVGWAWRDCKPKNLIVTRDGRLLPIDFEGATPLNRLGPPRWGTPGFTPAQSRDRKVGNAAAEDLYGMGSTLFLLLTGRVFDPAAQFTIQKLRRGVPPTLRQLVNSLLSDDPEIRPTAAATHATLTSNFLNLKRPARLEEVKAA
jgi:serine/threonine protein kinase